MVTGGASGMGLAMAVAFASAGANVAIGSLLAGGNRAEGEVVHMPGQEQMDNACSLIQTEGVQCLTMNLDVTSNDSVEQFFQATVERFGKVDVLANAAGITAESTICGHSDALWDKVIDVNLTGTYRAIKRVLPGMIERKWGRIINIASTAATVGAVTSGAYCASKAGVVGRHFIRPRVDVRHRREAGEPDGGRVHRRCEKVQPPGTSDLANRDRCPSAVPLQRRCSGDHDGGSAGFSRIALVDLRIETRRGKKLCPAPVFVSSNPISLGVHRRCWRQFGILTPCRQMRIIANDRAST
jgi:NADP-dependent 3-hydroxy acid dehydrogenase YdfG